MLALSPCPDPGLFAGRTLLLVLGAFLSGCGAAPSTDGDTPTLYINEFMAQNDRTIADPDGSGGYADWIELYNAGDRSVGLGGMYLTDDLTNPTKWQVPQGVAISARGYLLFWADADTSQGDLHTNFKLETAGEQIGLFDTAANGYAAIDTVTFGQQAADVSYGRYPDGSGNWQIFAVATPGSSNQ